MATNSFNTILARRTVSGRTARVNDILLSSGQEILPPSRFARMMLGEKFFQKLGHSVLYFSR